jgi:hypothetical protein
MEKNTKILLGVGAIIALYLVLKPKKAIATTIVTNPTPVGVGIVQNPEGDLKPIDTSKKATVEPPTKPCEVTYQDCSSNPRKEIIQIPYDDEKCDTPMRYGGYQPEPPPCAGPPNGGGRGELMLFEPILSNFA